MASVPIVEPLHVIEHICLGLSSARVDLPMYAFGLKRREEALHGRVVPNITGLAHAALDALLDKQSLELLARILAALVRVMQELPGSAAAPQRHQQRVRH